ncbi:class I SAM-dependent methyltransferase [Dyella subtropica]|uniref:class I SAM-dependent methyltransferase n=1 Tax=Dyella subtropica TaxID=2992127 RepID=UPI002255EA64|nr:class I SAM-dependent methyltransferase [Dyella subtropica]
MKRQLARIEAATSGYLDQIGWITTRAAGLATDKAGHPIPWFTYPAIALLSDRVRASWRVLEFGAGMGTLWWSQRVREVTAVEHSSTWASQVAAQCSARILRAADDTVASYVGSAHGSGPYDVVIVDGLYRNECLEAATDLLGSGGVIILDDAQREEYVPGIEHLRSMGYRMLPLHGPQPVSKHPGCTSIFYRDHNVLGL